MRAQSRLVKATVNLILNTGLTSLVGFLFWKIVSYYYPNISDVGQATTLVALAGVASLVATSGLSPYILLSLSNKGNGIDFAKEISAYKLISGLAAGIIAFAFSIILSLFPEFIWMQSPYIIIGVSLLAGVTAAANILDSSLIAIGDSTYVPLKNLSISLTKTMLLFILTLSAILTAASSVVYATFIATLLVSLIVLNKVTKNILTNRETIRAVIKDIKYSYGYHQLTTLGQALPPLVVPIVITGLAGTGESALFSIAWLVGSLFFTISPSVANALLSDASNVEGRQARGRFGKALILVLTLLVPAALVAVFLGDFILGLFGDAYQSASMLLILLAIAAFPDAFTTLSVALLRLKAKFKIALILNLSMGISTVVLIALLFESIGLIAVGIIWISVQMMGAMAIAAYLGLLYRNERMAK
jgi:O-antigen/teichoic acid export membrane protein